MIATDHPEASSPPTTLRPPQPVGGACQHGLSPPRLRQRRCSPPNASAVRVPREHSPRRARVAADRGPDVASGRLASGGGRGAPDRVVARPQRVEGAAPAASAGGGETAQTAVAQRPRLRDEEGAVVGGRVGRARSPKPSLIGLVFGHPTPRSEARALASASCVVALRRRALAVRPALHAITMAAIATARPNPRRCVGGRRTCHPHPPPPHTTSRPSSPPRAKNATTVGVCRWTRWRVVLIRR